MAQSLHLGSRDEQPGDALVELPSMAVEQVQDVLTGQHVAAAYGDDVAHLREGQPRRLSSTDEAQNVQHRLVVVT